MGSRIDSDKVRLPAVSGQFYPGDPDNLQTQVESYLKPVPPLQGVIGAVIPHAGYIYSGAVAGETVSALSVPDRVLILGPNHTGWGPEISVFSGRSWQMPFGEVRIDADLADQIIEHAPGATADILAHSQEHSIEVLLPFLYYARAEEFTFVPLTLSHISSEACRDLGSSLARIIESSGEDILVVASSDMTHYESHSSAAEKDGAAIERILDRSHQYRIHQEDKYVRYYAYSGDAASGFCPGGFQSKAYKIQYFRRGKRGLRAGGWLRGDCRL